MTKYLWQSETSLAISKYNEKNPREIQYFIFNADWVNFQAIFSQRKKLNPIEQCIYILYSLLCDIQ